MRQEVQEALENAIAEFEKRQQAEQERLRERKRFEADWAQMRTAVVAPRPRRGRSRIGVRNFEYCAEGVTGAVQTPMRKDGRR
jgi:hypothetical protein